MGNEDVSSQVYAVISNTVDNYGLAAKNFNPCSTKRSNRKHSFNVHHWHITQLTSKNEAITCIKFY